MQETCFGINEDTDTEISLDDLDEQEKQNSLLKEILCELKRIRFAAEILIDQSTENIK